MKKQQNRQLRRTLRQSRRNMIKMHEHGNSAVKVPFGL